ncbi:MAG: helix-turn-helix domain-containing protein [Liquorilactobacillus ghanensis]|uniref:MerR family transcriptional regulator n=1 Tax=Liquorilactobacillus ghanensis TaxID=399370 RepID=UPI0039E8837F
MKELFSIGQTAELFGISVQTLRYYSKIGILKPFFVDPQNNYRYYSYRQFHIIDRIRYLQHLGLSLNEIKGIYSNNDEIKHLKLLLKNQKRVIEQKIKTLENISQEISLYDNYFSDQEKYFAENIPFIVSKEPRKLLCISCQNKSREQYHTALLSLRHSKDYRQISILRQFVLILDFKSFINHEIKPLYMGFPILEDCHHGKHIFNVAHGKYLCSRAKLLSGKWDANLLIKLTQNYNKTNYVFAYEYENSITNYENSDYQIEIPIN